MEVGQDVKSYNAATQTLELFGGLTLHGALTGATTLSAKALVGALVNTVYGPAVAINASLGNTFVTTITDGVAFAISAPTLPTTGQRICLQFVNASGGAAGAGTFDAIYKMTSNTLAAIANGKNRSVEFFYNGTNWIEIIYSADVAN